MLIIPELAESSVKILKAGVCLADRAPDWQSGIHAFRFLQAELTAVYDC
jgi:hypothetical protein